MPERDSGSGVVDLGEGGVVEVDAHEGDEPGAVLGLHVVHRPQVGAEGGVEEVLDLLDEPPSR